MHVIVLGSGVVGSTTAWYLAQRGAQVTVVDRQPGPAQETSFANAGQISPGYAAPWAAPGIPFKALKWLFQRHAPLSIRPDGSFWQWQWLWQMLAECRADRYEVNKSRLLHLAEYSRDALRALRAEADLHYEERSLGTLQLFRSQAQLQAAGRDMALLARAGVHCELLDARGVVDAEPALAAHGEGITGGLRLPNDETGDCQLFTTRLAEKAAALGVNFRFGREIHGFHTEPGHICGVRVGDEVLHADRYVLALGSFSRGMALPLGLPLPIYPVKGYSLTVPIRDAARAPRSTVLDETWKVAVTRFANRVRVGGVAELAGFDLTLRPARRETLERVVADLFPGCGPLAEASFWCGLRPMTPDGAPLLGPTPWPELFLNTGHGTLGWTLACGSGRLLADLITGHPTDIAWQDLSVARYGKVTPLPLPAACTA